MKLRNNALSFSLALLALLGSAPALRATTTNVAAGANLQAAIDAAQPGDTLLLQAGATFTGPITLRYKVGTGTDADWITIRTATADDNLAPGRRVSPADTSQLAKIVSPGAGDPAIKTEPQAHHYKLIGLEVAPENAQAFVYDLVVLGSSGEQQNTLAQVPHHLVIDRCYIHAFPTQALKRGIQLNSGMTDVVDSYIADFKLVGQDAQAILGWNGPGPYTISNNYLEAAAENLQFGGVDPSIPNLVPSDIAIRGNYFYKQLSWYGNDPSYTGTPWQAKNLLELKNAQRVTIDGNVFENSWGGFSQEGYAILFTVRNQQNTAPWSVVQDVQFTHNVIRHAGGGLTTLGLDDMFQSQQAQRITVANNVFEDLDGSHWNGSSRFLLAIGSVDFTFDHNTIFQSGSLIYAAGPPNNRFAFTNNIAPHNLYGVIGDSRGSGNDTLNAYFPGVTFRRNVIAGAQTSVYPADNSYPATLAAVGFVNSAGGDYHLTAGSPYKGQGTDGKDPGADVDAVAAATAHAIDGAPPVGGLPFHGTPSTLPGTIHAADFDNGGEGVAYHDTTPGNSSGSTYRTSDVDMYSDNVLSLAEGEWLEYTVNIAATQSTYAIVAQVSATAPGGAFHIEVDGVDQTGPIAVPNTQNWAVWGSAVKTGVTLSAGIHVLRFVVHHTFAGFYSLRVVDTAVAETPFGGTARSLPGTVTATDFDNGGEWVAYHDNTAGCSGSCGYRSADIDRWDTIVYQTSGGEWMNYTVDVAAGTYTITLRVGADTGGARFHVEFDGVDMTGPLVVPATGNWSVFQTVTKSGVTLTAGRKVMRIVIDSAVTSDAGSFDSITVSP
ncbi:MAG: hypothetical protein QOJ16_1823 [Acidobacteriota bacterium]|jgi:hypothetical protein|nr:hypothetical protein [Acidobacteriota bacterium]